MTASLGVRHLRIGIAAAALAGSVHGCGHATKNPSGGAGLDGQGTPSAADDPSGGVAGSPGSIVGTGAQGMGGAVGGSGGGSSSAAGAAGDSIGIAGESSVGACGKGDKRCTDVGLQECDEHGEWLPALPCPAEAPVCSQGACALPPSCLGASANCGTRGNEQCCTSPVVPGGSYNRSNDSGAPAKVSTFRLDAFEITVGRFRKFVEVYAFDMTPQGAGKNPSNPADSGWNRGFNQVMPFDGSELRAALSCGGGVGETWTEDVGANENLPLVCLSWYEAMAFCIWDGGRLPSEAEWNYAAAGGSEQREYPWSNPAGSTTIDTTMAVYGGALAPSAVGTHPPGDARFGQADLAGNAHEWVLDNGAAYATPCNDCAETMHGARMARGGAFVSPAVGLLTWMRNPYGLPKQDPQFTTFYSPSQHINYLGARCARSL